MSALLHLVGFAPERTDQTRLLARACSPGDTLVLLDAGKAFARPEPLTRLRTALPECTIRVLYDEPGASGSGEPEPVDYAGLVILTETHRGPASWY